MFYTAYVFLKKGTVMIYRLLFNYLRIKILQIILNKLSRSKIIKSKNMNIIAYFIDLAFVLLDVQKGQVRKK